MQGEIGEPGQKGSKGDKGENVSWLLFSKASFIYLTQFTVFYE